MWDSPECGTLGPCTAYTIINQHSLVEKGEPPYSLGHTALSHCLSPYTTPWSLKNESAGGRKESRSTAKNKEKERVRKKDGEKKGKEEGDREAEILGVGKEAEMEEVTSVPVADD